MTNLLPRLIPETQDYFQKQTPETKELIDSRHDIREVKWVAPNPSEFRIIRWNEEEQFQYPSLDELRQQFETSGLYSKDRLDEIMKAYERLPKYRAQRRSASRSTKRG